MVGRTLFAGPLHWGSMRDWRMEEQAAAGRLACLRQRSRERSERPLAPLERGHGAKGSPLGCLVAPQPPHQCQLYSNLMTQHHEHSRLHFLDIFLRL